MCFCLINDKMTNSPCLYRRIVPPSNYLKARPSGRVQPPTCLYTVGGKLASETSQGQGVPHAWRSKDLPLPGQKRKLAYQ